MEQREGMKQKVDSGDRVSEWSWERVSEWSDKLWMV